MRRYEVERDDRGKFIVIGVIVILLCLVCVVGATLALFMSDPEDGKIGINVTTGKVQVDIVDTEQNSLVGDVLDFVRSEESVEPYFEPGAAYYTQGFQVKNIGDVSVNIRMYISEDLGIDKEKFEEAFEFWITTDPIDTENAEKLMSFTGMLAAGEISETYYLVVKMKETAGDEFQNKLYSGIGITVYAVQGNVDVE